MKKATVNTRSNRIGMNGKSDPTVTWQKLEDTKQLDLKSIKQFLFIEACVGMCCVENFVGMFMLKKRK